jgi:hypothetical protein
MGRETSRWAPCGRLAWGGWLLPGRHHVLESPLVAEVRPALMAETKHDRPPLQFHPCTEITCD